MFVFIWQGMMACMFNKGENCIAAGRLFVEASIHDEFVHRVVSLSRMIGSVLLHYWGAATHVAWVQVLPEIRRVGCGLSLVLGVTLLFQEVTEVLYSGLPFTSKPTLWKVSPTILFIFREGHLVDHIFLFSSGNCQMSPSLKKGRLLFCFI